MSDVRDTREEASNDDAPGYEAKSSDLRQADAGKGSVSGCTVTINRPRSEVYAFWRDFANLAQVMENVESISVSDSRRSHWKVSGPDGSYEWDSTVTEDEPDRLIAWQSDEGADVRNSGRVEFRDAPPGRGTWVTAVIAYEPPAGVIGKIIAKLTQREPSIQARRDLRRLKALLEAGEIPTSSPPNPQPSS